jgi:hypothetical protein
MINCIKCTEEKKYILNNFDTIGKTFYKIDNDTIMCYRHWHQENQPDYHIKGDYNTILKEMEK